MSDQIPEAKVNETQKPGQTLDFIMDVPLKITAEIGQTTLTVREVLQLAEGSVISLSKFTGEPVDLFINDKLISRGEVVVANEKYAVRLTDIISPEEAQIQTRK